MLGLKLPTDPRWIDIAKKNIEDILVDHAYCEQKAASSCISLIVQFSDRKKLVEMLTPVVAEEWSHFERVLEQLKKRGYSLGKQRTDLYVIALSKHERKGNKLERQLMDKLLINALIEARSCERFKLLYQQIEDKELKQFYYELMVSEAGHYRNFIELAEEYMPKHIVSERWEELLRIEAEIIAQMDIDQKRMH
ncbi:MAG: tRNA-(ms[2]io[6]A)-hydroxylase [Bacteroidota bacterium]|nr:tRNA-(ms[2]io[6]A)-hydroxylase [Bacteroidota bacterium]